MPAHPSMSGMTKQQRRQVVEHLEAAEATDHLVKICTEEQLREIIKTEVQKQRGNREGNLPLVLAATAQLAETVLGITPHPGQLAVAAALCEGHLVEYPTGEGKTLAVAIASIWLSGIYGNCHVATANDYLAATGQESMKALFEAAGIKSASIVDTTSDADRTLAHTYPIVYGTLSGFANDYLSDQLVTTTNRLLNPAFGSLVIDEADALLVDNATAPFALAGTAHLPVKISRYIEVAKSMKVKEDYFLDETRRSVWLTPQGVRNAEAALETSDIYQHPQKVQWLHTALMVAGGADDIESGRLYKEGTHYLVVDGKVLLIDQQGRAHANRRLIGGLHPALEVANDLAPSKLPVPVARVSTRGFVARYEHVSGTAGTLRSDSVELQAVYGKQVLTVGPHRPSIRVDHPDRVYATSAAKHDAIVAEVIKRHANSQPILIGTSTVNDAEDISARLQHADVPHVLLTARDHEHEATLISEAGAPGAVTISAKRAGRGVDIVLGGSKGKHRRKVVAAGGLAVIAAERFDSRRADRQLRGRCARQGDPGEALTFVSCEDELVRLFAGAKLDAVLQSGLGSGSHEDLRVPGLASMIDRAQSQLEQLNADIRQSLLSSDDLKNDQMRSFYLWRAALLHRRDIQHMIVGLYRDGLPKGRWNLRRLRKKPELLKGFWPTARPLPLSQKGEELPLVLAEAAWTDLDRRLGGGNQTPGETSRYEATTEAMVCAALEVADAEWSSYLATLGGLEAANENPATLESAMAIAYQQFQQQVIERLLQVVWHASFAVKDQA